MKVTIAPKQTQKYPYIGIASDTEIIVLFSARKTGVCLDPGTSSHYCGKFSDVWGEDQYFTPFHGSITLLND